MDGPIYHWGIYTYWLKSTTRQVPNGPCLFLGGELSVHLLLRLQHVPLSDGSPGVGQHVGPVAQLRPRAVEAHKDLADGIVLADLVIVQNSYNNLHFLWKGETWKQIRLSSAYRRLISISYMPCLFQWNNGFTFSELLPTFITISLWSQIIITLYSLYFA